MPRRPQAQLHASDIAGLHVERQRREEAQRLAGIVFGVQRQGGLVPGTLPAIGVLGVFLLQPAAVGQQHAADFDRGGRREHRTAKTLFDQQWQCPGMIEVRVGQNHGVELLWIEGKIFPVHRTQVLVTLEQTAIDQQLSSFPCDECLRAGDGAGATEECELHGRFR